MTAPSKDEKILHLSMLLLSEFHSPLDAKINVNQVAQKIGVSRAWVYKYFGATKEQIMLTAIDCLAPMLTELSKPLEEQKAKSEWAKGFLKGLDKTLQEAQEYPALFRFYFYCHLHPNPYLDRIKLHEGLFVEHRVIPQIKSAFGLTYQEARNFAEMLMATRMGLVLKWLNEPNQTPQARLKLINTVKLRVLTR